MLPPNHSVEIEFFPYSLGLLSNPQRTSALSKSPPPKGTRGQQMEFNNPSSREKPPAQILVLVSSLVLSEFPAGSVSSSGNLSHE